MITTGSTCTVEDVWKDRTWTIRPLRVVEDSPDRAVLWLPAGTTIRGPSNPTHRPRLATRHERLLANLEYGDWVLVERAEAWSSLWVMEANRWHATRLYWDDEGHQRGWYVNFQLPYRRVAGGFQTMDLMLDLILHPDGRMELKDEDDFDELISRGLLDESSAELVRAELAVVMHRWEHNESPFNEPWPGWTPDAIWPLPDIGDVAEASGEPRA